MYDRVNSDRVEYFFQILSEQYEEEGIYKSGEEIWQEAYEEAEAEMVDYYETTQEHNSYNDR